jgi:Icc-related predicted phosphoesterase
MDKKNKVRIAAIGDLHVKETTHDEYQKLFTEISANADVLALCGDLTDRGMLTETDKLIEELAHCTIPVVAVLGNHDYESDQQQVVFHKLQENRIHILEGTEFVYEKDGMKYGFTGVKGFGGGFRPLMWGRFGEKEQKAFYDAIATEVQQLEVGLGNLRAEKVDEQIVLLHFSPIRDTLIGEAEELYPFLGSTRLEEVIDRYDVSLVFHGHSHFGSPLGKTGKGITVYNVSLPLMQRISPDKPYRIVEL